jgi:hypothetical protein
MGRHPRDEQSEIIMHIQTERGLWRLACRHDGLDPACRAAAFTLNNPYTPDLYAIQAETRAKIEAYRKGGRH